MACGFESKAPPPGEHSFTNALIDVLDDWINRRSFSVSCLHSEILSQLKLKENKKGREGRKLEWCVTPIYINCTQDSKIPSIELCRRNILSPPTACAKAPEPNPLADATDAMEIDLGSSGSSPIPALSSLSPSGQYGIPHVIISVALEEGQPDLDAKKTARWLENIPLLAKWAKVEAVYQSYSTLLILSVPVPIWNLVPDHPACSFVGYATSPNLVTSIKLPMSSEPTPTSVQNKATALGDVKVGRNPRNDLTHDKCTPKASFPYSPFQLITPDLDDSDGYYGISSPESQLSLRESSTTGDEDETQWDLRASQTPSIDIMSESGNRIPLSKDDNKRTDIPSFPLLSSTPADANSSSSMFHLDAPSQSGIDPNSRASLNNVELMTLTESEEKRRIDSKNLEIEKWRSRACLEDKDEDSASWPLSIRHQLPHTDENAEISPLDDQDSIHENEPIEGRVYYNSSNPNITETDRALMALPRPWYDPPSLLEITTTTHQPPTSNDAMRRYQECSNNISISSRAATSGIRRPRLREVSLSDFDSSVDRSFLKRFSPSKPGEEPHHQIRLFERELDQLHRSSGMISIERGGKRKRAMSLLEMPQNQNLEDPIMPPRMPGSYTHSNFTEYEQPAYLPRAKSTYTPTDPLPLKYLAKHVSTAYEQPSYFSTAGSNYNPDSPINFQSSMSMYPSSFSIEGYGLDPLLAGTNAVNNARAYEMMDTGYAQPKSDQPKPYRQATGTDHTNLGSPIDLGSTGKSGKQLPGNP